MALEFTGGTERSSAGAPRSIRSVSRSCGEKLPPSGVDILAGDDTHELHSSRGPMTDEQWFSNNVSN